MICVQFMKTFVLYNTPCC